MENEEIKRKIRSLEYQLTVLKKKLVECPCRCCGEEVDIFGSIIDGKKFCGDCAEGHLMPWYDKHGRVPMDKNTQRRVARLLMKGIKS